MAGSKNSKSKESKKICRNFLLLYRILRRIQKGMYPSQIARQMRISKQLVSYYLKKAEKLNFVKEEFRSSFKYYVLTEEGKQWLLEVKKSSLPVKEKSTRLHNLAIKFPIIKDNPEAKFERETPINNWVKQYSVVTFPIGITIEKTTKSIIVYFHQFETKKPMFLDEFYSWVLRGIYYVYYYLMKEKGIQIDIFQGEIIREHIANESPEFNDRISKRRTVEISLGRKAKAIFPAQFIAKAWIDRSLGNVEIETNDMIYEEKLLLMPELVYEFSKKFLPAIELLAQQINLHLEVQHQQLEAIKELRKEISSLSLLIKSLIGDGKNEEK